MRCNVGQTERFVRILLALPLFAAQRYVRHFSIPWSYVCLAAGGMFLATAFAAWCPVTAGFRGMARAFGIKRWGEVPETREG